jgi:hypothetical protein
MAEANDPTPGDSTVDSAEVVSLEPEPDEPTEPEEEQPAEEPEQPSEPAEPAEPAEPKPAVRQTLW